MIKTIVLKGLWLCEKIYQLPSMRPGADIDILVHRNRCGCMSQTPRSEQGIGEFWPNLLKDEYFTRHHLHQQRSTPDLNIWFEIHWALDHPYTLLTVDYESIFERAKPARLLGAPIQEMAVPDLVAQSGHSPRQACSLSCRACWIEKICRASSSPMAC